MNFNHVDANNRWNEWQLNLLTSAQSHSGKRKQKKGLSCCWNHQFELSSSKPGPVPWHQWVFMSASSCSSAKAARCLWPAPEMNGPRLHYLWLNDCHACGFHPVLSLRLPAVVSVRGFEELLHCNKKLFRAIQIIVVNISTWLHPHCSKISEKLCQKFNLQSLCFLFCWTVFLNALYVLPVCLLVTCQKVVGSIPVLGPFCVEFVCSPRVYVDYLSWYCSFFSMWLCNKLLTCQWCHSVFVPRETPGTGSSTPCDRSVFFNVTWL